MRFSDSVYGEVFVPDVLKDILNSHPMQRLKDVNLDTTSKYFSPFKLDSRFEHCLGAFHLSQFIPGDLNTFELRLAALFHDIGAPPFTHISDEFMLKIIGKDHESLAGETILEFEDFFLKNNVSAKRISDYIVGKHLPGKLINSSIDIDNLDNLLRWAKGSGIIHSTPYDPVAILASMKINNTTVIYSNSIEVDKWADFRHEVYNAVYDSPNLEISAMITKALEIAMVNDAIKEEFFSMTEAEAITYLKNIPGAGKIMQMLEQNNKFLRIVDIKSEKKQSIAVDDYLADLLPTQDYYLHSFKSKDVKEGISNKYKSHYRIALFVHPKHQKMKEKLGKKIEQLL